MRLQFEVNKMIDEQKLDVKLRCLTLVLLATICSHLYMLDQLPCVQTRDVFVCNISLRVDTSSP